MARVLQYTILTIAVLVALGPVAWTIVSSLKTSPEILADPFALPTSLSVGGYSDAWTQISLPTYLLNSLLYATAAAIICPVIGLLAAYPCARLQFPLRGLITIAISGGLAVPTVSLIVPEFFLFLRSGLLDSKAGMILFYSTLFFPLAFVILRSFLTSLPREVEEAAAIDGASYLRVVFSVAAPIMTPAITTVSVLVFIGVWNDFLWNLVLAPGADNRNAQVALASFQGQFTFNVAGLLAGVTIILLVPVLLFLFTQRYAIAGLTGGALSGTATNAPGTRRRRS